MHDFDLIVSPYNGHMLRNLSKFYLFICCKQSSSTHFCHFLATTFVTDVLMGANPSVMGPKTKGPHSWEPVKSVVGDEGCPRAASPPASASGLRPSRAALENACAFPQLRTLAGSNPMHLAQKRKASIAGGLTIQWWAMRDVRVRLAPPAPRFVAPLLACCAGKRLRVSSAPHPCGFESHALGPKKKGLHRWRPNKSMVGDEGFEPPALCV